MDWGDGSHLETEWKVGDEEASEDNAAGDGSAISRLANRKVPGLASDVLPGDKCVRGRVLMRWKGSE